MFGFGKKRVWVLPDVKYYVLYKNMLEQPHLLIAGATGSGKSVVINSLMYTALCRSPMRTQLVLIDPKRVELIDYKNLPHTLRYTCEPDEMVKALQYALEVIDSRYLEMQRKHVKKYDGSHIYVVIDELADLMTTNKKQVQPLMQRIAQIGRAANVHIIVATQCPLAKVIPTEIKVNFDARLGLRTRSAQDSRNILGIKGCECLPRYGCGYYMTPEEITLYNLPIYSDEDMQKMLEFWRINKIPKFK